MENDLILVQLRQEKVRQWVNKYLRGEVSGESRPKELEKYFSHYVIDPHGDFLLCYNLRKLSGIVGITDDSIFVVRVGQLPIEMV